MSLKCTGDSSGKGTIELATLGTRRFDEHKDPEKVSLQVQQSALQLALVLSETAGCLAFQKDPPCAEAAGSEAKVDPENLVETSEKILAEAIL